MGIQGFTPSSGGLPGKSFIGNVALSTSAISWTQAGSAGKYTILSQNGNAGYAYFVGSSTVGGPLNGIIDVTVPFTTIKIVGEVGDVVTLFKVSVKTTSSITPTMTTTTWSSSQNGITLPTNQTGFIDAFLVGGGGGGSHGHWGSGGGGGGCVLVQSFPMKVGSTFNVGIGAHGTVRTASNGGNTDFNGLTALGGGYGAHHHGQNGGSGGCGGGSSAHGPHGGMDVGVMPGWTSQDQYLPSFNTNTWLSTTTAQSHGSNGSGAGHASGSHAGGGGGGASGQRGGGHHDGGDGFLLPWNSTRYGAGGRAARHSNTGGPGSRGDGWGNAGSGAGNTDGANNNAQENGTAGIVIVRSYSI